MPGCVWTRALISPTQQGRPLFPLNGRWRGEEGSSLQAAWAAPVDELTTEPKASGAGVVSVPAVCLGSVFLVLNFHPHKDTPHPRPGPICRSHTPNLCMPTGGGGGGGVLVRVEAQEKGPRDEVWLP